LARTGTGAIRPFRVHFSDKALADMKRRIAATRWPERETVADQSQGVQLATMQKLARYWENDHDWRKVEARAELPSVIRDDKRWAGHPFHPCSFEAAQCAPADHHA